MRLKILTSTNDNVTAVHVYKTEVLKGHTISSVVQVRDGAVANDVDDYDANDNSTDTQSVHVTIVFGGLMFHHQVAPESSVRSLKQCLMDERQVCLPLVEYELVMRNNVHEYASQKDVVPLGEDGVVLEDEAMALRFYGVHDGAVLHVERNHLGVIVQNQKGQEVWVMVPKMATVGDLKHTIMEAASLQCPRTFSLFTTVRVETRNGNDVINFNKLAEGNDVIVGHVLRDRAKLFMIENKFCNSPRNIIQDAGLQVYGMEVGDTVLSVRLRAQDQLGVSASHFRVERVFVRNPGRLPVVCPEQHRLKSTVVYRLTCRFTPVTHGFQFQPFLTKLAKMKSPRESNPSLEKRTKGTVTRHSCPTGTPGQSADVNVTRPEVITEMPSNSHAAHQAVPVTLKSSPGPHRNDAWVKETVLGEITNIPMVSAIQAVHNLFGGSALGTPVFGSKYSSQTCIESQGRDRSEVDSTHPEPQDSIKSTIPQEETNSDTTSKIVEDKSESTPNSKKDNPPNIEEHTSESLGIKEDKPESSKRGEEKPDRPNTEEYKVEPPNIEEYKADAPNSENDTPSIREDLLESAPSTEAENLLNTGETKQESTLNTPEDKFEEHRQNIEQDKVQSTANNLNLSV